MGELKTAEAGASAVGDIGGRLLVGELNTPPSQLAREPCCSHATRTKTEHSHPTIAFLSRATSIQSCDRSKNERL